MEHHPMMHPTTYPNTGMEADSFGSVGHLHHLSSENSMPLVGWGLDGDSPRESMGQYQQAAMPAGWPKQLQTPVGTSSTVESTIPALQQYVPRLTADWCQHSAFDDGSFGDWSQTESVPWDPGAVVSGANGQATVGGTALVLNNGGSVPPTPLESEPASGLFSAEWQSDELSHQREYQLQLTADYGAEDAKKRRGWRDTEADDTPRSRKRSRPSIQTQNLDSAEFPRYTPHHALLARSSISSASHTISAPNSAIALSFDTADTYHFSGAGSDTTNTPQSPHDDGLVSPKGGRSPRRNLIRRVSSTTTASSTTSPMSPNLQANSHPHYHHPSPSPCSPTGTILSTTTTPTTMTPTNTTANHLAAQQQQQQQPPTTTTTTTTTTTRGTNNGNGVTGSQRKKPTIRARNRAAASRYRAKTQAASAQLEADEREVSALHQTLLARASQLREEVFALKNELLRHADCDCPLIRGYLAHAAERACAGLGLGMGGSGGGGAAGGPPPTPGSAGGTAAGSVTTPGSVPLSAVPSPGTGLHVGRESG